MKRRTALTGLVAAGAGLVACDADRAEHAARPLRQPGITTPPPAAAVLAAFDVRAAGRPALEALLQRLSAAVTESTGKHAGRGRPVEVTVAVGASLFDGRFGLGAHRSRRLVEMPSFPNDVLDPARCHGDLLLQVCGGDAPGVASVLSDLADPELRPRWRMAGFRDQPAVTAGGRAVDRNLFGFRDGAGNPDVRDEAEMDRLVWVGVDGSKPSWAAGGSYQVVRIIRFATTVWDAEPIARQEAVFGRRRSDGAALGQTGEDAAFDYGADPTGQVTAMDAHIRRANPRTPATDRSRILRRGYSYRGGADRDEVMLFVCFQCDVEAGFATVQRRLADEALDRYVLPVGGGYFFDLPGGPGHQLTARAAGLVFAHEFWTKDTYSVRCGKGAFPIAQQREFGRFDLTDVVVRECRPGTPTGNSWRAPG